MREQVFVRDESISIVGDLIAAHDEVSSALDTLWSVVFRTNDSEVRSRIRRVITELTGVVHDLEQLIDYALNETGVTTIVVARAQEALIKAVDLMDKGKGEAAKELVSVLAIREVLGVIEELSPWLVVRARKTLQAAERLLQDLPYEVTTV
jgi:DNA-binding MltR family transcriptional regulator